jgi:hypothetical protein
LGTLEGDGETVQRGEPSAALRQFLSSLVLDRSTTWHAPVSGCHGFRFTPKDYRGHKEPSELQSDAPENVFSFQHPLAAAMKS